MSTDNAHSRDARAFRPFDPREYDYAAAELADRDKTIGDFLHAALRWFNKNPKHVLATLDEERVWPPQRHAGRRAAVTAYAVRDATGGWYGDPDLPVERRWDYPMAHPFEPADEYNPLYGQVLTLRCAELGNNIGREQHISPYAVRVLADQRREVAVRITAAVQDALFGPPITGTPERAAWERLRDQRRRSIET
ncbi:hypothetical protein ACGFMK_36045 [Amycolatopsis sp. NPDC049252]|uniref:hypothetical protein n=1 Tax=Amycolatopsis sp. NPDC049252 TaxID=3363933 RepID=UPI00372166E4